jgi:hypothetical protein
MPGEDNDTDEQQLEAAEHPPIDIGATTFAIGTGATGGIGGNGGSITIGNAGFYATGGASFKSKKRVPSPGQIRTEHLWPRARKIAINHKPNDGCEYCGCFFSKHDIANNKCNTCGEGGCAHFVSNKQTQRVVFTEFLRWTHRWVKVSKDRKLDRFAKIWKKYRELSYLLYCDGCDHPMFSNELHSAVKSQDGLQCGVCSRCNSCCVCLKCVKCKRTRNKAQFCKTCKVCRSGCCHCRACEVCGIQSGYDFCGFATTDYQRHHHMACGACNKCCKCSDTGRVPFGSFENPVFHKPNLKQHTINPTSRFIAAEIEVAGIMGNGKPIYDVVRKWGGATVGDGSLPPFGFEINSAPAGGDLFAQQMREVCKVISQERGFINNRCGLHVHVDGRDVDYYEIRRLIRVYAAVEMALFAMVSPNRIKGYVDENGKLHQYCQPCGAKYVAAIEGGTLPYEKVKADVITSIYDVPSTQDVKKTKWHPARYNALNLHSWFYRGTIEFRMFDGCIDPEAITNWGILLALLVDYAVKSSNEEVAQNMVGSPLLCLNKIIGDHKKILDFALGRMLMYGNDRMRQEVAAMT